MKTPKEFTDNIKNKIITREMLANALYSVNKRAKNCRDKSNEYRHNRYLKNYEYDEKYREEKEEYYELKELFLTLIEPDCIHEECVVKQRKRRFYDYEHEYDQYYNDAFNHNAYWDNEMKTYVEFIDVFEKIEYINYYLFYDFGDFSFHSPIVKDSLGRYENLEIHRITTLYTQGKDITDLISMQFVRKLKNLIESKDYTYVN